MNKDKDKLLNINDKNMKNIYKNHESNVLEFEYESDLIEVVF